MLLYRGEFEREVTDLEISGAGTGLIFRRLYRSSAAWNIAGLPNRPSPQRVDSVSSVTINWGDKSFTDSWDVRSAADAGSKDSISAPAVLSSHNSNELGAILANLKPYMVTGGRISVRGLTASSREAAHFSSIAGVPVSFIGGAFKDNWPGTGGTGGFQDNWPGIGATAQDDWST